MMKNQSKQLRVVKFLNFTPLLTAILAVTTIGCGAAHANLGDPAAGFQESLPSQSTLQDQIAPQGQIKSASSESEVHTASVSASVGTAPSGTVILSFAIPVRPKPESSPVVPTLLSLAFPCADDGSNQSQQAGSCTLTEEDFGLSPHDEIIASNQNANTISTQTTKIMAPLIGYFPPQDYIAKDYLAETKSAAGESPAQNEEWIKIDRAELTVALYQGDDEVVSYNAQGQVPLSDGSYLLEQKRQNPLWHASDNYFLSRKLEIPSYEDPRRTRRGALGPMALFITEDFTLHSADIWSAEVGGLRLEKAAMKNLFDNLPLGTRVVVQ